MSSMASIGAGTSGSTTGNISDSSSTTSVARRALARVAWSRTLLVATGCGLTVFLIATAIASLTGSYGVGSNGAPSLAARALVVRAVVALLAAVGATLFVKRRSAPVDDLRAALWVEEQSPSGYARVALAEDAASGGQLLAPAQRDGLRAALASAERPSAVQQALRQTARAQLLGPGVFFLIAVLVLAVGALRTGDTSIARALAGTGGRASVTEPAKVAPMGAWRVRLTPPVYSGLPVQTLGDAGSLRALAGSRVDIDGDDGAPTVRVRTLGDSVSDIGASDGDASDKSATRTDATPTVVSAGNRWRTTVAVPAVALEVRASRGGTARMLLVDGYPDSIPHVSLRTPARDSVLRTATGRMPLQAALHDDIGLGNASFELIVSSGEGERFTARTVTLGARALNGARDAALQQSLDLDALKLGPGDVIHLRAVARDRNPQAGRESGSSETRSFRIARQSEYDSIAVDPAPPPAVDSSLLSQRMLLLLAERLEKRRPTLERATLVSESRKLARDQSRLRQSVGDVVFQRLTGEQGAEHAHSVGDGHEHGVELVDGKLAMGSGKDANGMLEEEADSPILNINRPLLEAYNAMWDAGRSLELGSPREAIPFMRIALAAIERARAASRLYLRGKPPVVIVDIAKVRLAGKDTGATNLRSDRAALGERDASRERRLLVAAGLLLTDGAAARDSLALLRLDSVGSAPLFAEALAAALEDLRMRRDLTASLIRARRALGGAMRLPAGQWSRAGVP